MNGTFAGKLGDLLKPEKKIEGPSQKSPIKASETLKNPTFSSLYRNRWYCTSIVSIKAEKVELVCQNQNELHTDQNGTYDKSLSFLQLRLDASLRSVLLHHIPYQEDQGYCKTDA